MYLTHFALREPPFGLTPDTAFVFACTPHQEALNTLLIAVDSGEGFMKITGEVGTGKTLLCRRFLAQLDEGFVSAYLPNPLLDPQGLLLALAEELRIAFDREADPHTLTKTLNHALLDFARQGRRVIVCLDEVQAMPYETLESLRLLSNLETEKRKLFQVVLFGQPELDARLAHESVRQLRQRITFEYNLSALTRSEVEYYVGHRLRVAGYMGDRLFDRSALDALHRSSRGVPRLINVLAHKAMLVAFGEGRHHVSSHHVRKAAHDTPSARVPRSPVAWAVAAVLAAAALVGWGIWRP
ncbi:MAG TPA: AAA family ATPase [Burkholderiales bacterium]|jgi:MSHA biogenesis protein MshM|nr:AAA family ATPase [Burkholderiales bacterium]